MGLELLILDRLKQTLKILISQTSEFTQAQRSLWALKGTELVGEDVRWWWGWGCISRDI